jgi:hypothetical protein
MEEMKESGLSTFPDLMPVGAADPGCQGLFIIPQLHLLYHAHLQLTSVNF